MTQDLKILRALTISVFNCALVVHIAYNLQLIKLTQSNCRTDTPEPSGPLRVWGPAAVAFLS